MMSSYDDPFDALFALQRALDARLASDWMGAGTAARGSYPPVNIFQQGDDFVLSSSGSLITAGSRSSSSSPPSS
jgi:hypothetical protein